MMNANSSRAFITFFIASMFCASFSSGAFAQAPCVRQMYDADSLIPNVLLPFEVNGGGSVTAVSVTSQPKVDCRAMLDPFLSNHFLIKCATPTQAQIAVTVIKTSQPYIINYGPLIIAYPSGLGVSTTPPPTDPDWQAGKQLFSVYCISCHTANSSSASGASAATIDFALKNVTAMKNDASLSAHTLTTSEKEKLAIYLQSP